MENNFSHQPSPSQARDDLAAAAQAQAAIGARALQPWWIWVALGGCLGLIQATRALPANWDAVRVAIAGLTLLGMGATMVSLGRASLRPRTWGGVAWLGVLLVVAVVVFATSLSSRPDLDSNRFAPRYAAIGFAVAVVYAAGGILADRLRVRHAVRPRP